jgi:hypothetical protein
VNGSAFLPPTAVSRAALWLVLTAALLVSACSSLRLAYSQAPLLAYWWLDSYADFDSTQKPQAKAAIARWLAWHRQTQLPAYRQWLQQTTLLLEDQPNADALCDGFTTLDAFRDQALAALAEPAVLLARLLTPAQWQHIDQRFTRKNAEWQDDYLQPDPQDRLDAAAERALDFTERFYGRLNRAQKTWITQRIQQSPWRPENDLAERRHKQRDTLATLQALARPELPPAQAMMLSQAWLKRLAEPMDVAHAQARAAARRYVCEMAADFHREATPAQRRHLTARLRDWQADLDSVIVPALAAAP